jgi:DNA-directed RNA polymerase specialized sigma24 family protein
MTDAAGERAHAEVQTLGLRAKLLKLAWWRTRSLSESEELVQTALELAFDPVGQPWNPGGATSFFAHVGRIINGIAANAARASRARYRAYREDPGPGSGRGGEGTQRGSSGEQSPDGEGAAGARERAARLGDELRAALEAEDAIAARIFLAAAAGIDDRTEQAAHARCHIEAVRGAYDRIKLETRRILEREREAERELRGGGAPQSATYAAPTAPKEKAQCTSRIRREAGTLR